MANTYLGPTSAKVLVGTFDHDVASYEYRVALVTSSHTADDDNDEFYDDISGANVLALSSALANPTFNTVANGVFDSDAAAFAGGSITTGTATNAYLIRYAPGASDAARELVARYDTRSGGGALSWTVQAGVDSTLDPGSGGWVKMNNIP